MHNSVASIIAILLVLAPVRMASAAHSFEYIAEHLPEAAMDNRFATLPLFGGDAAPAGSWQFTLQGGVARTSSGGLTLDGSMGSAGVRKKLDERWGLQAFGFHDGLKFSGASDQRALAPLVTTTPLALPAGALFSDLRGTYRNSGSGFAFDMRDHGWLGERQWLAGALYQRVALRGYQANYQVLEGPSRGATGIVDYGGDYKFVTSFAGIAFPREFGAWGVTPHVLVAIPIPRRGLQGRITGPGFDLSGDTAKAGHGKPFGDFSMTFGLDVTYRPWGVTLDVGSFGSQALLERVAHKGIDRNWLVSASVRF